MTSTIVAGRDHVSDHIRAQRDKYLSVQENPGKQVGAPLPQKTPRKVLGDLKNSSSTQNSARKPPVLGTPKPAFVPARGSTSKQRERGRGGGVSSAHKVAPQRTANEFLLSELEHMAPPEPEKPNVFTVPSYVKALRLFRPTLPTGCRGQARDTSGDDCLSEPTRPKDRDEDLFAADKCAPPSSPAHLPDLAELDLLLNNL